MSFTNNENVNIIIDHALPTTELKPFWSATGYANADFTYAEPFKRMYDYLSSFNGHLHFMRLHNILTLHGEGDNYFLNLDMTYGNRHFDFGNAHNGDDKLVTLLPDGTLNYNWNLVDSVYDIIVNHGMAPIVEMVYLPSAIRKSNEEFFIPKDYNIYAKVVRDFVLHCQKRYGAEALRSWYFEIWNEPENEAFWCKDPTSFFALYDYMENAIHGVDEHLRVGGPATMQNDVGYEIFDRFLRHCNDEVNFCTGTFGTRVDFVSVHCKGGQPTDFNPSTTVMFNSIGRYLDILESYPKFRDTEFFNDESDIIWAGSKGVKDASWFDFRNSHYAPGFVCKMVSLYCTKVKGRGINLAIADSDNAHLQWERSLFSGNRSQLTPLCEYPSTDLIKKPFFNCYTMLAKLGNKLFSARSDNDAFNEKFGVIATGQEGVLSYLVWNFEDGISDEYGERTIQVELKNLNVTGKYKLVEYRIDSCHSNANAVWRMLGKPNKPTIEQICQLRARENLEIIGDVKNIDFITDNYSLELNLPQHAVSLVLLVPNSLVPPAEVNEVSAVAEKGFNNNPQVFLKWTPNKELDFLYYRIMRKDDDAPYKTICDLTSLNTAVYVDMKVKNKHCYTYKIVSVNASMISNDNGKEVKISID